MKFLVLDWFHFLLVDKGINLKDVTSGAFLLSINKNTIDKTCDREETEKGQRRAFSRRERGMKNLRKYLKVKSYKVIKLFLGRHFVRRGK